jgi:hypothetical protein
MFEQTPEPVVSERELKNRLETQSTDEVLQYLQPQRLILFFGAKTLQELEEKLLDYINLLNSRPLA